MRYAMTDFHYWDKPLVDQLKAEGMHIYTLIDTGGIHYEITKNGLVNRYGYLVTDEPLSLTDGFMTDSDFEALEKTEDYGILCPLKDISDLLEQSIKEYKSKLLQREEEWKKIQRYQNEIRTLEKERGLLTPKEYSYPKGSLVLQGLQKEKGKLYVLYFVRKEGNSTKSQLFEIPWNLKSRGISNRLAVHCELI